MKIRQSDIKSWQRCPLAWAYQNVDGLPRTQSASLIFGSIVHDVVFYLETTGDYPGAVQRFYTFWDNPLLLDPTYQIDYYVKGTTWRKFQEKGPKILKDWWSIIQWDGDSNIAREYEFEVPAGTQGQHRLHGTVDKLAIRFMPKFDSFVVLISDYKTNNKAPTYDYLDEDIQFSAYGWASTQREFWTGGENHVGLPNGAELYEKFKTLPRHGEWVSLTVPKRMDAGPRHAQHFARLHMAIDGICESVAHRIFIPNISGETCRYCEFRANCGLPLLDEEGNVPAHTLP